MTGAIIKGREHYFNVKYVGNDQGQKVGQQLPFTDAGTISKSCMFDDGDLPRLYFQNPAGCNNKTFTFSFWMKPTETAPTDGAGMVSVSPSNDSGYGGDPSPYNIFFFQTVSGALEVQDYKVSGNEYVFRKRTNRTLENKTKWYHIVCGIDTTQSTEADRLKLYIDGEQITSFNDLNANFKYPSLNNTSNVGTENYYHVINIGYNQHWDGYLAEFNFIDGTQYAASDFGQTDTSTGLWIPKSLSGLNYGVNGYRLQFANTAGQTIGHSSASSGLANNAFTVVNLAASDIKEDTPTNNIAVMKNYDPDHLQTISQGGLKTATTGTNSGHPVISTLAPSSGKWYAEVRNSGTTGGNTYALGLYILEDMTFWDGSANLYPGGRRDNADGNGVGLWLISGGTNYLVTSADGSYITNSNPSYTLGAGDVIGIAADRDNDLVTFYGNDGNAIGSATIPPGRICFTAMTNTSLTFDWNFGQNGTFNGNETAGGNTDENGEGDFYHSVPSGFKMLKQDNLSATDQNIDGGPTPPIPDLCWIKNRQDGTADDHQLYDSSRGPLLDLNVNNTNTESTTNDGLQKFVAGGFEVEDDVAINTADENYISWNWVAGGGTETANADGSGASLASTIQKNETAGFSIVRYSGSGTGSTVAGTVAHGLSKTPECIWIKSRTAGNNWVVYHHKISDPSDLVLYLNDTNGETNWPYMGDTDPTNKVFTISSDLETGRAGNTYMAYCWYGVPGFSRFGFYNGNGNADGPFVYTGFKPAMVMQKSTSAGTAWEIRDNLRGYTPTVGHNGITGNPITQVLYPNYNDHEYTTDNCDFLANGFKWRSSGGNRNDSGKSYVYMAWAVHPFNGNGENAFATAF